MIHDVEVAFGVVVGDVARVQPSLTVDGLSRGLLVPVIALHHLGPANEKLPVRVRAQDLSARDVDDLGLRVRKKLARRLQNDLPSKEGKEGDDEALVMYIFFFTPISTQETRGGRRNVPSSVASSWWRRGRARSCHSPAS